MNIAPRSRRPRAIDAGFDAVLLPLDMGGYTGSLVGPRRTALRSAWPPCLDPGPSKEELAGMANSGMTGFSVIR